MFARYWWNDLRYWWLGGDLWNNGISPYLPIFAERAAEGGDASEAGPDVVRKQLATVEPPSADEPQQDESSDDGRGKPRRRRRKKSRSHH